MNGRKPDLTVCIYYVENILTAQQTRPVPTSHSRFEPCFPPEREGKCLPHTSPHMQQGFCLCYFSACTPGKLSYCLLSPSLWHSRWYSLTPKEGRQPKASTAWIQIIWWFVQDSYPICCKWYPQAFGRAKPSDWKEKWWRVVVYSAHLKVSTTGISGDRWLGKYATELYHHLYSLWWVSPAEPSAWLINVTAQWEWEYVPGGTVSLDARI